MISSRYVRAHSSAILTIWRLGALDQTRIADISVEFKPNEFVDDSAVGLEGFSLYLQQHAFHADVSADTKHCLTVNLVCGRSQSVSPWSFSDRRVLWLSLMNLSYSWKMSLVLLAFGPVQTSCQQFQDS